MNDFLDDFATLKMIYLDTIEALDEELSDYISDTVMSDEAHGESIYQ